MTPQQHIDSLRAMRTRAEATAYVADLRGAVLDQVAALTHCTKPTAAGKRAHIVDATAGVNEDSDAIHDRTWRR